MEKGPILEQFLSERVQAHLEHRPNIPFVIVEIGTYCGYSSALMARTLLQHSQLSNFHIVTIDIDIKCSKVAQQFHELANLPRNKFTYIVLDGTKYLGDCIRDALMECIRKGEIVNAKTGNGVQTTTTTTTVSPPVVAFVFLDHNKDDYLPDLKHLEQEGIIQAQCAVAADNVIFFQLDGYRNYMQELADNGIVTTKLIPGQLEYILPDIDQPYPSTTGQQHQAKHVWQDGLELTIYHQDPSNKA